MSDPAVKSSIANKAGAQVEPEGSLTTSAGHTIPAEALIIERIEEIREFKNIFDRVKARIKNPQNYEPTDLKKEINNRVWQIIKRAKNADAVAVRKALAKLGFERVPNVG
jgi:hypothetical protein